ncbi:hypothetical protein [Natronorubrum halalkaliphilum]|uniref:hypothetical protein n=1 Tax=Natronorubrum halalkaliphilum TaxID=2691917 RepID=UPI001F3ABB5A|nr:hypothetical protein [Natronorubrum halalkaliphilum]
MANTLTDDVTSALKDAFPERGVDDIRPAGPSWNDRNQTVGVSFSDDQSAFLKVAVDGDASRITRECAVNFTVLEISSYRTTAISPNGW